MIETGVNLTLNDNASAAARRAAEGFEQVATAADNINSALDPRVLDQYNQKLTEIGQAYAKLDKGMKLRDQYQSQNARQMTSMIQSVGGSMVQAGRGDFAGGALSGAKSLVGMAGKILGPGALVAGGLIAGGMAGNALANIYGERAAPAQRIAALEGAMGTDVEANTMALRDAMKSTVDSVARFGKTYEEGAKARETFLRAGGTNFAGSGAAAYSLAMGADFGGLAAFTGMGQRYGQRGGLDVVNALMSAQGLGAGQFEEVMGGVQDTFSASLSRGIVRSMEDIGRSQEFFSRGGVAWQGALGAQRLQGMNQAVAGAAGLQQQSDLFLYRAAAGISGGDLLETKKLMEQGLTPELFKGLMGEFGRIGYGKTESVLQLSKMFGLSTQAAEDLYGLRGEDISAGRFAKTLAGGMGVTTEVQYIENLERARQKIGGEFGAGAFDIRASLVNKTMEGFVNLITASEDLASVFTDISESEKNFRRTGAAAANQARAKKYADWRSSVSSAKGVPGVSGIIEMLEAAEIAGVAGEDIYNAVAGEYAAARRQTGRDPSTMRISAEETKTIGQLLEDLIAATKETTAAVNSDTVIEDNRGAASGLSTFSSYID